MRRGIVVCLTAAMLAGCEDWFGDDDPAVEVRWSRSIPAGSAVPLTYPGVTDELVVGVLSGDAVGRSRGSGSIHWETPISGTPRNLEERDGLLFGAAGSTAMALRSDGSVEWILPLASSASHGRSALGESHFFVTGVGGFVEAVSLAGDGGWRIQVDVDSATETVVHGLAVSGDTIYAAVEGVFPLGRRDGAIVALSAFDGGELWRRAFPYGPSGRSSVIDAPYVVDGFVLGSDVHSNAVMALNAANGDSVWRWQGPAGWVGPLRAPVSADGIVYFGSGDEHVYALRLIDGSKVWSRQLDNSVNQVVVCGDYLLAERSSLEVLTRESGRGVSVLFDSPDDFVVGGIRVAGSDAYFATYETFVALDCSA